MSAAGPTPTGRMGSGTVAAEPPVRSDVQKMAAIWFVLSLVGDLIFWFVAEPHVPPGRMTNTADDQANTFAVLFIIALPVMIAVWVYMGYAIVMWRARPERPEPVADAYSRGHLPTQVVFISLTSIIVFGLFLFGTVELTDIGAGGGEGPNPIYNPSTHNVVQVQVIAQQWKFMYRYPSYGGFETADLVLPDNATIEFHVTSLDVTHSFWAYQLGVKADANPSVDNIAYTHTNQLGFFTVRCAELCGIWHGAMYDTGQIMTASGFQKWALSTEHRLAAMTATLPPYALSYVPDANGADGSYYPDNKDPYSPIQVYGAKPAGKK